MTAMCMPSSVTEMRSDGSLLEGLSVERSHPESKIGLLGQGLRQLAGGSAEQRLKGRHDRLFPSA